MTTFESLLPDLNSAIERLSEVLALPKNSIVRDSAIKRFEFCFDLAWKTVKAFLEEKHGVKESSPKSVWREAYRQKLIEYDNFWLELTDKRNQTAHTYKEPVAEAVYAILPQALENFKKLRQSLKE